MKTFNKWTEDEINKYLTKFIEKCWHKIKEDYDVFVDGFPIKCLMCGKEWNSLPFLSNFPNPNFFSPADFDILKKWMEKEQPGLWERYLYRNFTWDIKPLQTCSEKISDILNPRNLVEYLLSDGIVEEWGWVECKINGGCFAECIDNHRCKPTEHKAMHPALEYAAGLER